jgi:hypothetical protein
MRRRGFLGGLLASPLLGGVKPEDAALEASGISINPIRHPTPDTLSDLTDTVGFEGNKPWFVQRRLKLEFVKLFDSSYFEEAARRNAKEVHSIEPDILALRSVSAAGKVAIQRERNFRRLSNPEHELDDLRWREREDLLFKGAK